MSWPTLLLAIVVVGALAPFVTILMERVPTSESLRPRPRCASCATALPWTQQFPVISWLVLRGRCSACGRPIGWRTPVAELLCVAGTILVFSQPWPFFAALAWLAFVPVAVALSFIDLEHKRLPNLLTLRAAAVVAVLLGIDAALHGWSPWLRALLAGVTLFALYLLMNLLTRGAMGMGDVKLALTIGLLSGYLGWFEVVVATASAFMVAGAVSAVLLLARVADRRSTIPFGPFMVIGLPAAVLCSAWARAFLAI